MSSQGSLYICTEGEGGSMVPVLRIGMDTFSKGDESNNTEVLSGGSVVNFKDIMNHINVQKFNDIVKTIEETTNDKNERNDSSNEEEEVGGKTTEPVEYFHKPAVYKDLQSLLVDNELQTWYDENIQ